MQWEGILTNLLCATRKGQRSSSGSTAAAVARKGRTEVGKRQQRRSFARFLLPFGHPRGFGFGFEMLSRTLTGWPQGLLVSFLSSGFSLGGHPCFFCMLVNC